MESDTIDLKPDENSDSSPKQERCESEYIDQIVYNPIITTDSSLKTENLVLHIKKIKED